MLRTDKAMEWYLNRFTSLVKSWKKEQASKFRKQLEQNNIII